MKHHLSLASAIAGFAVAAIPASAIPLGLNITVSDQNYSGSGWYGNHEDNETETHPDTLSGQNWDLEGMFLQGSTLTVVGGFDFKNGVTHSGHNYRSGDVFIDLNGDAVYGYPANGGAGTGGTTTSLFGYDLVLDLDYTTMTFDLLQLTPGSVLGRPTVVASSNPWRYVSGGTAVAGYQDVAFSYVSALTNADVGLQGYAGINTHYAISLDTSFLPSGTATIHYTVECGNDNLMGVATVPDGGSTVALLGVALVGLTTLRRRSKVRGSSV